MARFPEEEYARWLQEDEEKKEQRRLQAKAARRRIYDEFCLEVQPGSTSGEGLSVMSSTGAKQNVAAQEGAVFVSFSTPCSSTHRCCRGTDDGKHVTLAELVRLDAPASNQVTLHDGTLAVPASSTTL